MNRLERPIASDWLALRRPADERAREASRPLLDALADYFAGQEAWDAVEVIDVGAGTGANQAWLAPRLQFRQRWTLLDHDPDLLALTPAQNHDTEDVPLKRVVAGIEDLDALLRARSKHCLVTCSALLDLLSATQLDAFCDLLGEHGIPALLSLSVTGAVDVEPGHPFDAEANRLFNDHQERGSLLGPAATSRAAARLRAAGLRVEAADTPWELESDDLGLASRYLQDRAEAIIEQDPARSAEVAAWLADRMEHLRAGRLGLRVGHRDLLCLPPQ